MRSYIDHCNKKMIPYLNLQGTPVNIIVGSHVWIEDPEVSWIDGQVLKINGTDAEIEDTNGKKVCRLSECQLLGSLFYSIRFFAFLYPIFLRRRLIGLRPTVVIDGQYPILKNKTFILESIHTVLDS